MLLGHAMCSWDMGYAVWTWDMLYGHVFLLENIYGYGRCLLVGEEYMNMPDVFLSDKSTWMWKMSSCSRRAYEYGRCLIIFVFDLEVFCFYFLLVLFLFVTVTVITQISPSLFVASFKFV